MLRIACAVAVAAAWLVLIGPVPTAQVSANFKDSHAQGVMQATRMAVGRGPQAIDRLGSLVMRGTSRVAVDEAGPLVSGDVEIKVLLPRHCLRIDRSGASERLLGFAGRQLLSVHREGDELEEPPSRLRNDILKSQRTWFGRLLLGSATYVLPDLSVMFRSVFRAPSEVADHPGDSTRGMTGTTRAGIPDPNLIEASGNDGFSLRLFLDSARFPDRLEYHFGTSGSGTMRFGDRREVDGIALPHRITTYVGKRLVDELVFDEILVNPELSDADFTKQATLKRGAPRIRLLNDR